VPHLRDGLIVAKVGHFRGSENLDTLNSPMLLGPGRYHPIGPTKINSEKVENFRARKVTVNLPAFTSNPPRIHHQTTTFCTLFLPKPPAKMG
jgi:hypothetical protein